MLAIVYSPSSFEIAPKLTPSSLTVTPSKGSPDFASVILPRKVPVFCAVAKKKSVENRVKNEICLSIV